MDAEREERLGELISDWLESRETGHPIDRPELLARYPEYAEELTEFFVDEERLRELAAPLRESVQTERAESSESAGTLFSMNSRGLEDERISGPFGNYELLEEMGRGGMAVVYRARHKTLDRLVALKVFSSDCLNRTDDLQRFRHEAEIVAHLDHPQIVPIYEVGEHRGHAYFTMKLMEGGLDAQLPRFVADPRAAAKLLASIARAVHHAHQRGILHRDLKPSNILLTEAVPHVSDFGLAKRVGADSSLTHTGDVVGTPAYMAPEQAASAKTAITTATDIYGLGAVLYALLTGRPPFAGSSVLETLAQVKEREPEPPRRSNAKVSRDLETICLKCLHKEPQRRYESSQAVADDLDRWLRGEPITARPINRLERLWRWCKRQPVQASLAAALFLAVLTGVGLVLWQWRRAEDNLATVTVLKQEAEDSLVVMTGLRKEAETNLATMKQLRQEAVDGKRDVDANFQLAHQALRDIAGLLQQGGQHETNGLDALRREILLRAQTYFKRSLERRGQDLTARIALAQSSAVLADIIRQTDSPEKALDAYHRTLELYENLLADLPDNIQLRLDLSQLHNQQGSIFGDLDRRAESDAAFSRGKAVLEKALADHPADRSLQSALASTRHNLGRNHAAAKHIDAALACYGDARDLYEKLIQRAPDDLEMQRLLANTYNSIGILLSQSARYAEALEPLRKAVGLSESLTKRNPENRILQHALAQQLGNLGDCLSLRGQAKEALEPLLQARAILDGLVRGNPALTEFQVTLGLANAILAQVRFKLNEPAQGFEALERSRSIFRSLVANHPQVPDFQRRLSQVLMDLGQAYSQARQDKLALDVFQEALDVTGRLAKAYPADPDNWSRLGMIANNRAIAQAENVSISDARGSVLQAVQFQRRALDLRDALPYRSRLSSHYALLAALERESGHIGEAVDATRLRLNLWPTEANELYRVACDFVLIGNASKSDAAKQQQCYEFAMDTIQLAIKAGYRNSEQMRNDPLLTSLRERKDFQKQLSEMILQREIAPPPHARNR